MRSIVAALALLACLSQAAAQAPSVPYTDAQLIDGFVRTVFGAENPKQHNFVETRRVKKFVGTVRVALVNLARQDRRKDVSQFLDTLYRVTPNLRFSTVSDVQKANLVIYVVDRADYVSVIRRTMPRDYDTTFLEENDCSAVTGGRANGALDRAFVYLVADNGERNFRHCLVEEIVQALGPVNDSDDLPHSILNDRSDVETFVAFDWFILNMLYDRRVRPGMSEAEVRAVLPAAIADCRRRFARVARTGLIALR